MYFKRHSAALLVLGLSLLSGCDSLKEQPVYKIGYMNCNNEQETMARFKPLTSYLSEQLGVRFEAVNDADYAIIRAMLRRVVMPPYPEFRYTLPLCPSARWLLNKTQSHQG